MRIYGLIGNKLSHSFSKKYFSEKFAKENIANASYELFELESITDFPTLIAKHHNLAGLNVTIPYKQSIIQYLDELDPVATRIGAVNVIKFLPNNKLKGYNSDYYGFKKSLQNFISLHQANKLVKNALILGNGGAAQAVKVALEDLEIAYTVVSQKNTANTIPYHQIANYLPNHQLLIHTSPLGMYPNIDTSPQIPYHLLTQNHLVFDLVYNPLDTLLLQKSSLQAAKTQNGLEMLHLQAEKAWEIWNIS
jgi:shikimate dehydrogenase